MKYVLIALFMFQTGAWAEERTFRKDVDDGEHIMTVSLRDGAEGRLARLIEEVRDEIEEVSEGLFFSRSYYGSNTISSGSTGGKNWRRFSIRFYMVGLKLREVESPYRNVGCSLDVIVYDHGTESRVVHCEHQDLRFPRSGRLMELSSGWWEEIVDISFEDSGIGDAFVVPRRDPQP